MGAVYSLVRRPIGMLSAIQLLVATTIIVAALALWTWTDFAEVASEAEVRALDASLAVNELAQRSLLAIDVVLESVAATLSKQGVDNFGSDSDMNYLRQIARRLPETGALFIVDKAGNVVAGTGYYSPNSNGGDREWFRNLREGKTELFVGSALKGRGAHNLFFPVARSIRGPDGAFIGAVQVGVEVTYFASLFRNLNVVHGAHLGLYGTHDGKVVARYPMSEGLLDETVATTPFMLSLAQSHAQSWLGWIHGGQNELVSARRLDGWPLISSAAFPAGEVYAGARTRVSWRFVVTAMIIAVFLTLNAFVVRQSRREAVLISELEHRNKNMLAVVLALIERAGESAKSSAEFASSVRGRIRSMASTQGLLSETPWRGVNLANLICIELDPYKTGVNVTLDGPEVLLTPKATHGLAMVLHELTTNAAKYGALSQQGGQVSVWWVVTDRHSAAEMLRIHWKETGGPTVAPPDRQGHGSSVIRGLLSYELNGSVDLVFAPDGVCCTVALPARSVIETTS